MRSGSDFIPVRRVGTYPNPPLEGIAELEGKLQSIQAIFNARQVSLAGQVSA